MRIKHIICKLFSHKWDETNPFHQSCKRCKIQRALMYNRYSKIGDNPYTWKIMDFEEISIP